MGIVILIAASSDIHGASIVNLKAHGLGIVILRAHVTGIVNLAQVHDNSAQSKIPCTRTKHRLQDAKASSLSIPVS